MNASGQFVGVAEMIGAVDFNKNVVGNLQTSGDMFGSYPWASYIPPSHPSGG